MPHTFEEIYYMTKLSRPESQVIFFSDKFQSNFDSFFHGSLIFELDLTNLFRFDAHPEVRTFHTLLDEFDLSFKQARVIFNPSNTTSITMAKLAYPCAYMLTDSKSYKKLERLQRAFKQHATKMKLYSHTQDCDDLFLSLAKPLSTNKAKFKSLEQLSLNTADSIKLYDEAIFDLLKSSLDSFAV